jgi:hypothetical protein
MKDNQKKYLDKVVDLIVSDTIIDYGQEILKPPFSLIICSVHFYGKNTVFGRFSKYCKNSYGLGEDEIRYVWDKYINIIKEKIK